MNLKKAIMHRINQCENNETNKVYECKNENLMMKTPDNCLYKGIADARKENVDYESRKINYAAMNSLHSYKDMKVSRMHLSQYGRIKTNNRECRSLSPINSEHDHSNCKKSSLNMTKSNTSEKKYNSLDTIKKDMQKYYYRNYYKTNNPVARVSTLSKTVENNAHPKISERNTEIYFKDREINPLLEDNNFITKSIDIYNEKPFQSTTIDEETELFLNFIRNVNENQEKYRCYSEPSEIPMHFKYRNEDHYTPLHLVSENGTFGSDCAEQYVCIFCNMKYTYRRCLMNHIKKKHRHAIK